MSMDLSDPDIELRIIFLPYGGTPIVTRFVPDGLGGHTIVSHDSGEAYHNAGGGFGGVPASGKAVAGLKRQKHGDDDDDAAVSGQAKRRRRQHGTGDDDESTTNEEAAAAACAICLEDFVAGDGLAVMPCAHRFHDGCLTEWLALSRLCPCCRHALPSEDDGEGEGEAPPAAVSSLAAATSSAEGGGGAGATDGFQGRARQAATRRSRRARQANVRLFGPEWAADTSDNGLGLQQ